MLSLRMTAHKKSYGRHGPPRDFLPHLLPSSSIHFFSLSHSGSGSRRAARRWPSVLLPIPSSPPWPVVLLPIPSLSLPLPLSPSLPLLHGQPSSSPSPFSLLHGRRQGRRGGRGPSAPWPAAGEGRRGGPLSAPWPAAGRGGSAVRRQGGDERHGGPPTGGGAAGRRRWRGR